MRYMSNRRQHDPWYLDLYRCCAGSKLKNHLPAWKFPCSDDDFGANPRANHFTALDLAESISSVFQKTR